MHAERFITKHAGIQCQTRRASVVIVESPDGYLVARAEGDAGVSYSASRTTTDAVGSAVASAVYGDYHPHEQNAFTTADDALAHARWLNTLGV